MRSESDGVGEARAIMEGFARRTGLTSDAPPKRYLWTDAFAVCNLVELAARTGEAALLEQAVDLVDQVHRTLGRHRPGEARSGWISGLSEEEGARHPTAGGLRIGKPLPERRPEEPYDARAEWDRDGQYFHYLTKWMQALVRVGAATSEAAYARWAVELGETAFRAFAHEAHSGTATRMYWKMSVDLSRPLVPSMGQHDPLDGLGTYLEAQAAARELMEETPLAEEIQRLAAICAGRPWATDDPLGAGGLLSDLLLLVRYPIPDGVDRAALIGQVAQDAARSVEACSEGITSSLPAGRRLAFRELGFAIGLSGLDEIRARVDADRDGFSEEVAEAARRIEQHAGREERIVAFWRDPQHQQVSTWTGHREINEVMLATSLIPEGYLEGK